MTNDDERVAYLAGEEGAEVDDLSRADLDELLALLDDADVWAEPGDHLEDAVVAAIAAAGRTAGSRRGAAAPAAGAAHLDGSAGRACCRRGRRHARRRRCGRLPQRRRRRRRGEPRGTRCQWHRRLSQTDSGWRIELDAEGLPRLDDGRFYQAWLKNDDDVLVAIGTFNEPDDVVLWAGVSPKVFRTLTVTEEAADGDQASSGVRVLAGTIALD